MDYHHTTENNKAVYEVIKYFDVSFEILKCYAWYIPHFVWLLMRFPACFQNFGARYSL